MTELSTSRREAQHMVANGAYPPEGLCTARQMEARAANDLVALALWSRLRWRELLKSDPRNAAAGCVPVSRAEARCTSSIEGWPPSARALVPR